MTRLALRQKPAPTCGSCRKAPARRQGMHCAKCHAAYMRNWRTKRTMEFRALKARVAEFERANVSRDDIHAGLLAESA